MKNKAGMWFVLAIGGAVGLAIVTGFAYYTRKYDDQFASIKAMDPKMRVRESRLVIKDNTLQHWRLYESDKPVLYYCEEVKKVNPQADKLTSQIAKALKDGGVTWFFAAIPNAKGSSGIVAQISGGTYPPGFRLKSQPSFAFPDGINKAEISKSTLAVSTSQPVDPFERLLAACGFYR